MTTEAVLILFISVVTVLAVFLGPNGPVEAFKDAGPQLAAKIERSISIGNHFQFPGGAEGPGWR